MASSYSNPLRLEEIGVGEASGTWGTLTNTTISNLATALAAKVKNLGSDADATLTMPDGSADDLRALHLKITSTTLTATRTITIAPNTVSKVWIIENATTGNQAITFSQGSGSNVSLANGETKILYTDGAGSGAAVVDALTDLNISGTTVLANATVSTAATVGGVTNGVSITQGAIALKNGGTQSAIDFYCEQSNAHYTRLQSAPHSAYSGNITLTLPASDGNADQVLSTDGNGVMSWVTSGGLYNAWLIKTAAYTAISGDQLIANAPSTAFTITLPASPSAGDTVSLKNVGAALLTVGRNGSNILSQASDATMPTSNAAQLIFVDATIGWTVL
tara:strand:+ start:598 stop:1599 length:1002 start_codon:yes stop_codon:yes gene_type:complete